jgi:hypothetical protein
LAEKPEGKGTLGRLKRRRVDNMKMDFGKIVWSDAQNRDHWRVVVNAIIKL